MKMSTAMRIVALSDNEIWIQGFLNNRWEQLRISHRAFEVMMQISFPRYVEEYAMFGNGIPMVDYFYHYGETEEMRRKGDEYIFIPEWENAD